MSETTPLISVVMSVYNDQKYLTEAVESVLNQTVEDFEFIIFDDGSSDNSIPILKEFAVKDKRIRLHINDKNIGLTKNLNVAIDMAKGEFIARMDADDVCMPNRFERQIDFLKSSSKLMVCGSWTKNIDEDGKEISVSQGPNDKSELGWLSIFRPPFAHPTAMFRARSLSDTSVKYDEHFRTAQDFELWSRLEKIGEMAQIPEYLLRYRTHVNNVSTKRKSEQNANAAKVCFANIQHYFPDFVVKHGESTIKQFSRFVYGFEGQPSLSTRTFSGLFFELQNEYLASVGASKQLKDEISKLTIRWIIQSAFIKNSISWHQKLAALLSLTPYLQPLIKELSDYKRRRRS